jgi:hypothetical protein
MTKSSPNYINYMGNHGWYDQTLIIDPQDHTANTVYAGGNEYNDVIRTTDGGLTWNAINIGADGKRPHPDHHAIGFDANGKLLDGNDGGLWRLDDPNQSSLHWTDINGNLQITQFTGISMSPTNPHLAIGGSQDNGTEVYFNVPQWNLVSGGDGGFVRIDPNNPQRMYTEDLGVSLTRSDNGGQFFSGKFSGILGTPNLFAPYVLDAQDSNRVLLGTQYVNLSPDGGDTWTQIGTPGVNNFNPGQARVMAIASTNLANTVYAAMTDGTVWVTTTNGQSWTKTVPIPGFVPIAGGSQGGYEDLEIDSGDPTGQTAYLVTAEFSEDIDGTSTGHHVLMTTTGGASWQDISGNLPDLPTWSVAIDHANHRLFVGNDSGVFYSVNGGTTWSHYGTGMPNVEVDSLQYSAATHVLAAGTHGRGMFEIYTAVEGGPVVHVPGKQRTTEGTSTVYNLGTFTDSNANASPYQVDVNWGDGTPHLVFTTTSPGLLASVAHTYQEEGTYTVTVTVTDKLVASNVGTFTVVVFDPAVVGHGVNFSAQPGVPLSNRVVASFTDPGGPELSPKIASHYSATIDWGDGSQPTSGTILFSGGTFTVSGNHTYALTGLYILHVTIAHESAPPTTVSDLVLVFPGLGGGFLAAPAGGGTIFQPASVDWADVLRALGGTPIDHTRHRLDGWLNTIETEIGKDTAPDSLLTQ